MARVGIIAGLQQRFGKRRTPKKRIGIVGAGIAGLHLGLYLQQAGIDATIYTEHAPKQILASRLANLVVRSAPTREHERQLGVAHWDKAGIETTHGAIHINGDQPATFTGVFDRAPMSVDMRLYCARLLEDFMRRGGRVRYGPLQGADITRLAEQYDHVVAASGRGALSNLFPRLAEHSPYNGPQRVVVAGMYRGVALEEPCTLHITVIPGQGEIISFPMVSFEPGLTGIAFESIPGGVFDAVAKLRYEDDPPRFNAAALTLLREHAPWIHERIDPAAFAISRPLDQFHIAITPTVRAGYARLANGKWVMALGDAHVANDPIIGEGANTAAFTAWILGEAIRDADRFDEAFCHAAAQRIWAFTHPVTVGTNAMLAPPKPHLLEFIGAATQHQAVADSYLWGYNHPDQFWTALASPERTAAFIAEVLQQAGVSSATKGA
jgi:2-polyprenyl-6-methoxyphenol hydroxylase-like FAD-dependent oxidoreductase